MTRAHVLALAAIAGLACHRAEGPRMLDAFDDLTPWHATASDGVTSSVRAVPGVRGPAMQLAFDLGSTAGYAVARRDLALDLPGDFELTFQLRGDLPVNNLELKLIDASGENVWWYRRANYAFPTAWREIRVKRSQIEFAWGPATDHTLRKAFAIELVVSAGKGGGKGTLEIDELALRAVPPITGPAASPIATASSEEPGHPAAHAIDGDAHTAWRTGPGAQTLTIDYGRERDFGGALLSWGTAFPRAYALSASRDGQTWQPLASIQGSDGGLDPIAAPESSARYLRLSIPEGSAAAELAELALLEAATPNDLVAALARRLPRGSFPRGFSGEQPYWTVVGVDGGGDHASLLSEDGALELATGATVEPFVESAAGTTSWATVPEIVHTLDDGYLPIPSVTWRAAAWELTITALATGDAAHPELAARYTLRSRSDEPQQLRLVLAVRPLQVNPPLQFLNIAGGVREIHQLAWNTPLLSIDGAPALQLPTRPDDVALWPFHAIGYPTAPLAPAPLAVDDPHGLASGAFGYVIALAPGAERSLQIRAPLAGRAPAADAVAPDFDAELTAARAAWHARLERVGFRVPPDGQPLIDTLRSSLAYMLLSRAGPVLRPGTRSYARAWIRDGAMISEALLRLGHPDVASDFLRWYAPFQFASGKVPCCVERGAVPVPENDSHGELIHLAAEIARYTHDREQLAAVWPHVQAAARYLDELRRSERTAANQTPERRAQYGLLPPTISHEGYSVRPAYSYWDDFWGLVGLRDAAWIAGQLGEDATALAASRDEFARDLVASIAASVADHHIPYLPGAAELGDFDATSTTIALSPGGAQHLLPAPLLEATFERAWQALLDRKPGGRPWTAYTPYELRLVGAFVRLGWRARANDALAMYLADRRPAAWNQWAEVVGRDLREPRFVGDMPHAWVHSDYARSVLDLFAHERDDGAWVLAAGVPAEWFTGTGFAIDRLPTPFGPLSYSVAATARAITLRIDAGALPAGGLALPWPLRAPPGATSINGTPARWRGAELPITQRPATIVIALTKDLKESQSP
ncbi:MAG TPA: discoidin domain-containing protein [Kofleriaceae bacterium]|nr:discoidin domain-containing protein [Kofleriaceae bacterium]